MLSAEAWATRITPEPFRDFLPYTSVSALKVIHTPIVLRKALDVMQHYGAERLRANVAERLSASIREAGLDPDVQIGNRPAAPLSLAGMSEASRTRLGERLLRLYFHLLKWDGPLFLDLRLRNLAWDESKQRLTFYPSGLWCQPDREFRRRVQALYAGFYQHDPEALTIGVELYSWDSDPLPGFAFRIEKLLRDHFGGGDTSSMRFSLAHFRQTFDHIFQEAAQSRAKLHPDLTFLGVGLVGLYLTLDALEVPLDPKQAFEASLAKT